MNVPLTWLICGTQVYCLIEIINLLMGASLLALAKSLYYRRAYKQASPTQRFLPGGPLSSPQSSRRLVMTAPPQKTFPEFAQVGLHTSGSSGDWTVHIATSQFFYTLLHNNDFFDLFSTPQADFQSTVKSILGFIIPLFPRLLLQQHVSSIQVENFRYSIFTHYIPLQPPLSLNFAIHTFLVFVHGEIQSYKIWTPVFSGYFRNVFIVIIISFCLCLFLVQNTVPFEKLNTI